MLFDKPKLLASVAPLLVPFVGQFTSVVGHSLFGDLFLRNPDTKEYAILLVTTLELVGTGEISEGGFKEQILNNTDVVRKLFRPDDVEVLRQRIGFLDQCEAFFPVPLPVLGGSGKLDTYGKGGLWEYLGIVAQSILPNQAL
jgi:hypothetical protein